jgi:hypothetical protein
MIKFFFFFTLALALSGCGGVSATDVATALKDDPNSACIHVENSYPPFQNKFTVVRTGRDGVTVAVNSDCSIAPSSAVAQTK